MATKKQREVFVEFTRDSLSNLLIMGGLPREAVEEAIGQTEFPVLTAAIEKEFLERVDFKTINKVAKFLKGEEYTAVMKAANEVLQIVGEDIALTVAQLMVGQATKGD